MPVTKQQREYALMRISNIFSAKRKELEEEHYVEPVKLDTKEKWDLVKKGEVKPNKYNRAPGNYQRWTEVFDFSKFETDGQWSKTGKQKISKLEAEEQNAKDTLMLGDAAEALAIIEQYK